MQSRARNAQLELAELVRGWPEWASGESENVSCTHTLSLVSNNANT